MSPFIFNPKKAAQAAAVILGELPGRKADYYPLLKLLYIADRQSLRDTGTPITGARPVAMRRGPLPMEVYACIMGNDPGCEVWNRYLHKEGYVISVSQDPGADELCPCEIEQLKRVAQNFGTLHPAELGKITEKYAEYRKHEVTSGRRFIPMADLLAAVGRSEQAANIIQEAEDRAAVQRLFGGTR